MANMVASLIHTLSTHTGDVTCLAFSQGKLATASSDKTVRLWTTINYAEFPCSPLLGHSYIIHCCTFSPSGTLLATCSTDGKLILWDAETGEVIVQFQHASNSSIRVCRFSPNSAHIVTGSDDDTICMWDIAKEQLIRSYVGHEDTVIALTYSPDGHFLVSGSPNGDLCVWDAAFGHGHYLSLKVDVHDLGVTCCEFSPTFGSACTMDSPDVNLLLATGGKDNLLKLWTFKAKIGSSDILLNCHDSLPGHTDIVMCCAFSPSGSLLVSGSLDKSTRLWDPLKGVALFSIDNCHSRCVTCCAFSPDGDYLGTGAMDQTVKIWKMTDTSEIMNGLSGYEEPEKQTVTKKRLMTDWTVDDVAQWLGTIGLSEYEGNFRKKAIGGTDLLSISTTDLQKSLGVLAFGHRKKILRSRDEGLLLRPSEFQQSSAPMMSKEELQSKLSQPSSSVHNNKILSTSSSTLSSSLPSFKSKLSSKWTVEDVAQWLRSQGLSQYQDSFRQNAIDGVELLHLSAYDLETIGVAALGHRNKILRNRNTDANNSQTQTASSSRATPSKVKDPASNHNEFLCPITMEIMKDPVIAADGYTYDRNAITSWLEQGKDRSPMTNAVLAHKDLTPNHTLKMVIQKHLEKGAI